MWPFNKTPAETKDATARLKAFRDVGDTFNYLGRTCVVTAHSRFYPGVGHVPALCFQYADDHGKLHSVVARPYEIEAIEKQQNDSDLRATNGEAAVSGSDFNTSGSKHLLEKAMKEGKELYKKVELTVKTPIEPCPVCGADAELWKFSTDFKNGPIYKVLMCSNADRFGPQDGAMNEGCLLHMPPQDFYRGKIAEAVKFWNDYAKALIEQRRERTWKRAIGEYKQYDE